MAKLTEEIRMDKKKCCICGKEFYGHGNNPEPVKAYGVCCDDCNTRYVLPARIDALRKR